ncbi:hypothetical protein Tco_1282467 [Tanacetum coccineum]
MSTQEHLVDTNTKSRPVEDLRETEVPQPLLIVPSPVPSSDDLHLTVGQAHTPATVDTESEPEEAPLETEEFEASEPSDTRITTSIPQLHRIPPHYSRIAEAAALSPSSFRKSSDSNTERKGLEDEGPGSEDEGPGSEDEGPGLEEEEAAPEVSPSSPAIPTPVASLVTTSANTIAVDEDVFLEAGTQLELHRSILHDHTQRLDALPPTLFEGYD